ncbi:hypothetical protein N806_13100 [Rhodococcus sp. P27]|nr:hypothetical protein N806_13100 [Rhodococcus sp. P27]
MQEPQSQFRITGNRVRTKQRLNLPRLSPLRVVRVVRLERANHRSVAAFRTQSGVDFERRIRARCPEKLAHLVGNAVGPLDRNGLVDALAGFAHEQHVRIGSIAEFAAAESAHADDGETGRRLGPEFGDAGLDHRGERCIEHRGPHRGQRLADGGNIEHAEDVGRSDARKFVSPQRAGRGNSTIGITVSAGGGEYSASDVLGLRLDKARSTRRIREQANHVGSLDEQVG